MAKQTFKNSMPVDPLDAVLVIDQMVPISHALANEYLTLPTFEGERNIDDVNVNLLLSEMRAGRFNWNNVTIARCELDGISYRVNGQHTCIALSKLPQESIRAGVTVREQVYRTGSLAGLKTLYSSFDRGKARSNAHLIKVELAGTSLGKILGSDLSSRMAAGVAFWQVPGVSLSPPQQAALLQQHAAIAVPVAGVLQASRKEARKRLLRQAVIAAMMETYRVDPLGAASFWSDIAQSLNMQPETAKLALYNWLNSHCLVNRGTRESVQKMVNTEDMYRVCIQAWNRHVRGERVAHEGHLRPTKERVSALVK